MPKIKSKAPPESREEIQRSNELKVQSATVVTICSKIAKHRDKMHGVADDLLSGTNDGREIGILIQGFLDKLPGKRMTTDFWQQYKDQFVIRGKAISHEELNWYVRLANSLPEPVTDLRQVFAARQMTFQAAGFELIGDRPPGMAHEPVLPYNEFLSHLNYAPIEGIVKKLERDPNYGPIHSWPAERKEILWVQVKPLVELLLKLKPI
jgi:hypothetical protein